jgi:hypothetical protein
MSCRIRAIRCPRGAHDVVGCDRVTLEEALAFVHAVADASYRIRIRVVRRPRGTCGRRPGSIGYHDPTRENRVSDEI